MNNNQPGFSFVGNFIASLSKLCKDEPWGKWISVDPSPHGVYVSDKNRVVQIVVEVFDDSVTLHYRVDKPSTGCPILPMPSHHTDFNDTVKRVYEFIKEYQ